MNFKGILRLPENFEVMSTLLLKAITNFKKIANLIFKSI